MQKACCCPAGSWPALKTDYTPIGQMKNYESYPVYHIGTGNRLLVIFQDIFGIESGRHKAVADNYSALGYNVFMPELIEKPHDGPVEMPAIMASVKAVKKEDVTSRYQKFTNWMKTQGYQKWVVVGFCWGVWAAFNQSITFDNIIAIAGMHPSLGAQNLYGSNEQVLSEQLKCPAFLCPAQNDPPNVKKDGVVIKIMQKKFGDKVGEGTEEYPDMMHGWMVRGDLKDQKVYRDVEKGMKTSDSFLKKFI